MPLHRGRITGYDARRMTFDFTMQTSESKTIDCSISSLAMDRLSGRSGFMPREREAQFAELRDKIEEIASENFDRENTSEVRIFLKHVEHPIRNHRSNKR